jgi:HSP20 family protein
MNFYIRSPYGRYPQYRQIAHVAENWDAAESQVYFPVDVREKDNTFTISAMLPGLKPEEVEIQIINETVSLKGNFETDHDEEAAYILQEKPSGKFCRTITLSDMVDASKAQASMENGILKLEIPKAEQAKPKIIQITKVK